MKAKARYADFLRLDFGISFAEFLGIEKPRLEMERFGCGAKLEYRYARHRWSSDKREVIGPWRDSRKAAKKAYKELLRART